MNTRKQSGFAALELLLIIFVVVLIGGIAWYSYQARSNVANQQQAQPSQSPASSKINTADGAVQLTLAKDWKVTSRSDVSMPVKYQNGTQVLSADLAPTQYSGESRWHVLVVKSDLKPKKWSEGPLGLPSAEFVQQSEASINGYEAYYAKIANKSYVDLNYVISSNGYVVYFQERESDKHYTPQGVIDESNDFAKFTPGFVEMVNSIQIK
jgi:hypothetical protein